MAAGVVVPGGAARSQPVTCRVWTGRCWTPVATGSLRRGDLVQLADQYPVIVTSEGWVRDPMTGAFVLMRHHYGRFVQDMYRGVSVPEGHAVHVFPGKLRGHYIELHSGGSRGWLPNDGTYTYWRELVHLDLVTINDATGVIDAPYTVKVL